MDQDRTKDPDELLSVKQAASELAMGESTMWLLIKRHGLPRFRLAGRSKTTFVRRGDVLRAYNTPTPITPPEDAGKGKAAT